MGKHTATKNLVIGEEGKKHRDVKKGDVFEVSDEYAKEHLIPFGHVEAAAKNAEVTVPPAEPKEPKEGDKEPEKGGKGKK